MGDPFFPAKDAQIGTLLDLYQAPVLLFPAPLRQTYTLDRPPSPKTSGPAKFFPPSAINVN